MQKYGNLQIYVFLHWNDLTNLFKYLLELFFIQQSSGHAICLALEATHEAI